jgi:NADH-quinone oxidoreductase subunit N
LPAAFFVYGAALVYGATGSTQFTMRSRLAERRPAMTLTLLYAGIALLIVGFGFKVSLVPFHMWTPDVYQGAPTPVTAFHERRHQSGGLCRLLPHSSWWRCRRRSRRCGGWRWRSWPC